MKGLFAKLSNRHESVFKYVIIFNTILLIVIALPKETTFSYEYQKGKPWAYDNLIAPFSFAITKTDVELNEERAEVLRNTYPFFHVDDDILENKVKKFREEVKSMSASAPKKKSAGDTEKWLGQQERTGVELLESVFDKGIIQYTPGAEEEESSGRMITLMQGNVAEEHQVAEFHSIRSASDFIRHRLDSMSGADAAFLLPLLENSLAYNVIYDDAATRRWTKQRLDRISFNRGLVQQGEVIILKGEVLDDLRLQKLESLKQEMMSQELTDSSRWMMFLGHFILVTLAISILVTFLFLFRREVYDDNAKVLLIMLLIILVTLMFLWVRKAQAFDLYLVPVCILPITVRAFFDTRTALFTHIVTLLILGFEAPNGFEYMFIQTIAGMVAIFTIVSMSRRVQFFISVLMIFLSYAVAFFGISILHEASFRTIDWMSLRWFLGNSIITLFAFPLIFIFEKVFGFLSDVSLMELADSNTPLLRELAQKAPGTFQHSLQVANLAEAAAYRVGGNPLLARVGALYHDIGKADMPQYFIENQNDHFNPHDGLSFEESAKVIKSHVIKGIEKARKNKVPDLIIDFIRTHHGDSRIQYFYQSYLKNFPDQVPDEELFRYPGPLPFSKETVVLMMADSVEAASHSLKTIDPDAIDKLVDSVIEHQMESGQYDNAPITLRDIQVVRKLFKKMLLSVYHTRVAYPA
ncbi:MAG: HD family phosphohydrolase [Bacteroidota bacterium]